jgi:hypothetical protein
MRLNLKPDLETGFRFPDFDHIGAGIAGYHWESCSR